MVYSTSVGIGTKLKATRMASFGLEIVGDAGESWVVTHMHGSNFTYEWEKDVIQLNLDNGFFVIVSEFPPQPRPTCFPTGVYGIPEKDG